MAKQSKLKKLDKMIEASNKEEIQLKKKGYKLYWYSICGVWIKFWMKIKGKRNKQMHKDNMEFIKKWQSKIEID